MTDTLERLLLTIQMWKECKAGERCEQTHADKCLALAKQLEREGPCIGRYPPELHASRQCSCYTIDDQLAQMQKMGPR